MIQSLTMNSINERQESILNLFDATTFIKVSEIAEELNVSEVTIRKDLKLLESKGLLYRTHGGARKQSNRVHDIHVNEKEAINVSQKIAIAQYAANYVNENDFIIIASGTTLRHFAKQLTNFNKLTVITPSLIVANELCNDNNIDVIQLGGEVRKSSASVVGSIAETILKEFSCNKLFLSVDGIDTEFGLSTSNAAEAHLNNLMINCANKVYILADSSKINKRGFGKICSITEVNTLITDKGITEKQLQQFTEKGVDVVIVDN